MARSIATSTTVALADLLDFVRPRYRLLLATTRRDGRPKICSVSGEHANGVQSAAESQSNTEEPDTVPTIRLTVADQSITAQLADNPTAQDLAEQLPLTLSIRDFNRVEKIAELPRPLIMKGVPAGDDPDINDIGYYAPSNDLVFYYGEVGYFNGIVRIGQVSGQDSQLIERQQDGTQITIERA